MTKTNEELLAEIEAMKQEYAALLALHNETLAKLRAADDAVAALVEQNDKMSRRIATYAELVEARAKASTVQHASAECAGFCIVPAGDYKPRVDGPRGVGAFNQNRFCSTAKLEFELLLKLIAGDNSQG